MNSNVLMNNLKFRNPILAILDFKHFTYLIYKIHLKCLSMCACVNVLSRRKKLKTKKEGGAENIVHNL